MFRVEGREVAMDAAGALLWRATELTNGTLYLPQQSENEERTVDLLTSARLDRAFDEGNDAQVFLPPADQPDDLVIKQFHSYVPHRGGLPDLRINVLTEVGLADIPQRHPFWQFRGLHIMGAFVSKDRRPGVRSRIPTRWVMERIVSPVNTVEQLNPKDRTAFYVEKGVSPNYDDTHPLPRLAALGELCDRALKKAIGDVTILKTATYTHDIGPSNLLIERIPEGVDPRSHKRKAEQKGVAVKIDAAAYSGFDY